MQRNNIVIKNFYRFFIIFYLTAGITGCKVHSFVAKVDTTVIKIDSSSAYKEDSSAIRLIKPYKDKMEKTINEVLGYTDEAMDKDVPEGLLNNFVADLILKKANEYYKPDDGKAIDFCLLNNGGLRTALPKGVITRGKIYELMPFENSLVVVTLSGNKILQMFSFLAKTGGMPISGFTMGIKDTLAVNVQIKAKPFDANNNYKVVTSDYLANGGDKMTFFTSPVKYEDTGIKMRDAIIDYIIEENKKGNSIKSKLDKRIYYEQ